MRATSRFFATPRASSLSIVAARRARRSSATGAYGLGGVWSEAVEGTNGIGTCIADRCAVTVHQTQHFRSRHTGLSCSGAPVFDADGLLVAVLDVSSMDPQLSAQAHALTLPLVVNSRASDRGAAVSRAIFPLLGHCDRASGGSVGSPARVDKEHRVIGADRFARRLFALDQRALEVGTGLWTIFSRDSAPFSNTVYALTTRFGSPARGAARRSLRWSRCPSPPRALA